MLQEGQIDGAGDEDLAMMLPEGSYACFSSASVVESLNGDPMQAFNYSPSAMHFDTNEELLWIGTNSVFYFAIIF